MSLTTADEQDLLIALHDGLYEQPLWITFLDRLRTRTGAGYAALIFRPPGAPESAAIELHSGQSPSSELRQIYNNELYKQHPLPYFSLRPGRVYDNAELLDMTNPVHEKFNDLLLPNGLRMLRIVRITEPGGTSALLCLGRDNPDFSGAQSALLSNLVPHVQRALRHYASIERQRIRNDIGSDVMQRMNFGWISLDSAARIIETSPHADRLLQHCSALRRDRHGRLVATRTATDGELTAAIKQCALNPMERPRALSVSRDPWLEILVVPAKREQNPATMQPTAIAYLQGDNQSADDRHLQIADLFGLQPNEARLALALSRGMSISEAAVTLRITVETARNYSKKIYSKMGARGQADVIRFVLASVLALA